MHLNIIKEHINHFIIIILCSVLSKSPMFSLAQVPRPGDPGDPGDPGSAYAASNDL